MQKRQKQKWTIFVFSIDDSKFDIFSSKKKKWNTKTKTKVDVKGKKQKVFLSFPTIIPSSTFSKRLLIFVLHHWSMIEMHSQAEAYTLHYSTLSPLCPILFFYYIFYIAPPLFLHFHSFLLCTLLFLMCALLFYIFALRPTLFALPLTSCTFYHAFLCVFFFYTVPCIYQSYHQSQVANSLNH